MSPVINNSWVYNSTSGSQLSSLTISFNLQETIAHINISERVKNYLEINKSHIFQPGIILSNEDISVLAFQPNCKCEISDNKM